MIRSAKWTRLWAALATLFVATMALVWPARADEAVATPPRDVPLLVQPASLTIPPVPGTYQVKDLGWIRFAYVPGTGAHERVAPLIHDAEEIKARLADELGQPVLDKVEVRIARTPEEMATLAPVEAPPPAYGSGVAYPELKLVLLTLSAPQTNEGVDLDEVFRHELVHVALADAVLHRHVPRWFNEGLAIHESGENPYARTKSLMDGTLSGTILPLSDIDRNFPADNYEVSIAYAESADFVSFLMRKSDRVRFQALVARVRDGEAFERSIADAYGSDIRKLEFQWKEALNKRFTYIPVLTGGSLVWVLVIVALVVGYVKRRRRAKATLARWEKEEAALDAAIRAAKDIEERPSLAHIAMQRKTEPPKVEHDGRWHTLH